MRKNFNLIDGGNRIMSGVREACGCRADAVDDS